MRGGNFVLCAEAAAPIKCFATRRVRFTKGVGNFRRRDEKLARLLATLAMQRSLRGSGTYSEHELQEKNHGGD
jgi:hypothetical protein